MNIDKKFEVHLDYIEAANLSHMIAYALKHTIWAENAIETAEKFIRGTIRNTITDSLEEKK